jgi:hypothetical protein
MAGFMERFTQGQVVTTGARAGLTPLPRQTERTLVAVDHRTLVRMARVQAEGLVQTEKVRQIDHLTRQAMGGQAMLRKWADVLSGGDLMLAEELRFFTDLARMGKGEIIADTIDTYCRESRGS